MRQGLDDFDQNGAMLSDDVYRTQLTSTFAAVKLTAAALGDVADIDRAETADFVRLSLMPRATGACPVELMLRTDQLYDIAIATEFYEDCPIERFDVFVPLLQAIASGNVVQRIGSSAVTGIECSTETIVTLPDGGFWRRQHTYGPIAAHNDSAQTVFHHRRFTPYRR